MFSDSFLLNKKTPYIITALCIGLLIIIFSLMFFNSGEKTPLNSQQVSGILTELDYNVIDSTEYYLEKTNGLLECSLAIESDGLNFNFFEFSNSNTASNAYSNIKRYNIDTKVGKGFREYNAYYNNYNMYTMYSDNTYYTVICVENTVIFAYCDEDKKADLDTILVKMDYDSVTKR